MLIPTYFNTTAVSGSEFPFSFSPQYTHTHTHTHIYICKHIIGLVKKYWTDGQSGTCQGTVLRHMSSSAWNADQVHYRKGCWKEYLDVTEELTRGWKKLYS